MAIMNCKCRHDGQDQLHGPGRRVFNETAKKDPQYYRCTVCGNERASSESSTTINTNKKGK